jgi:hypothetical protein
MKTLKRLVLVALALATLPAAAEERKSPLLLAGPPVNVNLSAAGTLPKGMFFNALNVSFADKTHSENGSTGPEVSSRAWLLKLRYGLTDNLEFAAITPYIELERSHPTPHPKRISGVGDQIIGLSLSTHNIRQRDPFSLHFTAAAALPTGGDHANNPPGNGVWGWRLGAALGLFPMPDLRFDTELVWTGPFERGNQDVRRGQNYQWNAQVRRLFRHFDLALESSVVRQDSGNRRTPGGTVDLRNGYTEWFVGPSANVAIDALGLWMGAGIFFPVSRHFDGPNRSEKYRLDFKIGKVW